MLRILILYAVLHLYNIPYSQTLKPEILLPVGHSAKVNCIAISNNSKLIATGGGEGWVIIWDAQKGIPVKRLQLTNKSQGVNKDEFAIQKLFFSNQDDKLFVIRGFDEAGVMSNMFYELWDIRSERLIKKLPIDGTSWVKISNDDKYLLAFGLSTTRLPKPGLGTDFRKNMWFMNLKTLSLWDIDNNKLVNTYPYLDKYDNYIDGDFRFDLLATNSNLITITRTEANNIDNYNLNVFKLGNGGNKSLLQQSLNLGHSPVITAASKHSPLIAYAHDKKIGVLTYVDNKQDNSISFLFNPEYEGVKGLVNKMIFSEANSLLVQSEDSGKAVLTVLGLSRSGSGGTIITPDTSFVLQDSLEAEINCTQQKIAFASNGKYFVYKKEDDVIQLSAEGGMANRLGNVANKVFNASFKTDERYIITSQGGPFKYKDYYLIDSMKYYNKLLSQRMAEQYLAQSKIKIPVKASADTSKMREDYMKKNDMRQWDLKTGRMTRIIDSGFQFDLYPVNKNNSYTLITDAKITGTSPAMQAMSPMLLQMQRGFGDDSTSHKFSKLMANFNKLAADTNSFMNRTYGPRLQLVNNRTKDTFLLLSLDTTDYLIVCRDGYYMGSAGAAKKLNYVVNGNIYSFQQLDLQYNRPDIILKRIGLADTSLTSSYKRAYYKRLNYLHIDTASLFNNRFHIPEAHILAADSFAIVSTTKKINISISASDSLYFLDRVNILINGVPLYGKLGLSLKNKKLKNYKNSVSIELSQGSNKIEVSALNELGAESYRNYVQVSYSPQKKTTEKLYFIGIGVDKFKESEFNLRWSVKDIKDLATNLITKYGNDIQIDTIFNTSVTKEKVKKLKEKILNTSVDDKVIVAYSGHGLLSNDDYYLSTWNTHFNAPEQNGLPYDNLEDLLDSIPARKKLLLIDACHSGEIDKDDNDQQKEVKRQLAAKGVKGIIIPAGNHKKMGLSNSFELMQELFINLRKSTGATIVAAAAGTQFALENGKLQNGVFTYSILEYMQQHQHASVDEIMQYVNRRVPELTEGLQVPTARGENVDVDWQVW